jgi:hypothetical protein
MGRRPLAWKGRADGVVRNVVVRVVSRCGRRAGGRLGLRAVWGSGGRVARIGTQERCGLERERGSGDLSDPNRGGVICLDRPEVRQCCAFALNAGVALGMVSGPASCVQDDTAQGPAQWALLRTGTPCGVFERE